MSFLPSPSTSSHFPLRSDDDADRLSLLSSSSDAAYPKFGCCPAAGPAVLLKSSPKFLHRFGHGERLKKPECLKLISSSKTESSISDMDKVPMDFSNVEGKIISDPEEAKVAVLSERSRQTSRIRSQSPDGRIPNVSLYNCQPWFHQNLSREEAVDVLKETGSKEGSFLVRTSEHLPGCFILSLVHLGTPHHFPICPVRRGSETESPTFVSLDSGKTRFRDLVQLVEFYQINAGVLPTPLLHYITKYISIPSGAHNRACNGGRNSF